MSEPQQDIVIKVGAVIRRTNSDGEMEVLVIQPSNPKNPADVKPMGMVRGTRKYFDEATATYVDADHDGKTLPDHAVLWEPVDVTLFSEVWEEAGIGPNVMDRLHDKGLIAEMGVRTFASLKKDPYPIHWFVIDLDRKAEKFLLKGNRIRTGIVDSDSAEFMSPTAVKELAEKGRMSAGYLHVIEEALALPMRPTPDRSPRDTAALAR